MYQDVLKPKRTFCKCLDAHACQTTCSAAKLVRRTCELSPNSQVAPKAEKER